MRSQGRGKPGGEDPVPGDAGASRRGGVSAATAAPVVEAAPATPETPAPLDAVPSPGRRAAWQQVDGEAVVIDLQSRRVMGLNKTGSFLWCAADGKSTIEQLAARLAAAFPVSLERARSETAAFFGMMARRGLVELA